jgi:tRNA G18 (ribose-2'-O)-methylase SpoU
MCAKHFRHKPPTQLDQKNELLLVVPALKSQVNLARLVRLAGCAGIGKIITAGSDKVDSKIARDGAEHVTIEKRRSLIPVLKKLREAGYHIVALEQTESSEVLYRHTFSSKTALLIGHEGRGIPNEELAIVDTCVEIPVYGMPHSYNVVTATTMAVYEYCRQIHQ